MPPRLSLFEMTCASNSSEKRQIDFQLFHFTEAYHRAALADINWAGKLKINIFYGKNGEPTATVLFAQRCGL